MSLPDTYADHVCKAAEKSGFTAGLAKDGKTTSSETFRGESGVLFQGIAFELSDGICSTSMSS